MKRHLLQSMQLLLVSVLPLFAYTGFNSDRESSLTNDSCLQTVELVDKKMCQQNQSLSIVSTLLHSIETPISIESNQLTLSLSSTASIVCTLYALDGQEYFHHSSILHSGEHNIEIPELDKAIYFVRVEIDGNVSIHKIVTENYKTETNIT